MNRRNFVLSTALLAAVAIAPTACKKDGGGGASGASGDMLSFLPKDSAGVVGISWSKARNSALFKKYEGALMENIPGEVAKIKKDCGIDLMADINTIVVAGNTSPENSIVAVKGAFDQAKVEECIGKMGGKAENGAYTVDGDVTNAYWASKDTVLFSEGLASDKIKAAAAGGSLKDNTELMGLIGKVDTSATVWAAGQVPADAAGGMMGMMGGSVPKWAYMSLGVDSGINAKVGLVFDKAEDATKVEAQLTGLLAMGKADPQMKELLGGVSSKTDGKAVVVKAKLSGGQLDKLKTMAGGSLPF